MAVGRAVRSELAASQQQGWAARWTSDVDGDEPEPEPETEAVTTPRFRCQKLNHTVLVRVLSIARLSPWPIRGTAAGQRYDAPL